MTKKPTRCFVTAACLISSVGLAVVATTTTAKLAAAAASSQDWPTYLHDNARSAATTDANLTGPNASLLQQNWAFQTGGPVVSGVSVVGTTAYVGSWDGYEYALNTTNGSLIWKTYLGMTKDPACSPPSLGVSSTATVSGGVVYVGGGNAYWYALDASTGAVLWSVYTGDNSPASGHYNWSSPLIVNGYAYIGVASVGDCPVVQGQVLQVSLTTHQVVNTYNVVPTGQLGGGVWTSPTFDPVTNTVFVATGNLNDYTQTQSQAIVALDGTTLQPKSWWQLPYSASVTDSDWSTTPELTTDTNGDQLLSVGNKNGILYTFNRNNLAAGPIWQHQIAVGGDCLTCGQGTVSSGTFANGVLYWAGANTVVNGQGSGGSIVAFDPGTGNVLWTRQTDQPILTSLAYVNGMVAEVEGSTLEVLDAGTGALLYSYVLPQPIEAPISVAQSQFFVGALDGRVYSFGLGPAPATPPPDPNCPSGFTCQDIHKPLKGSESTMSGVLTVTASGSGVKGTGDQFRLVSEPVSGSSQESVEILSQSAQPGQSQQAGLMVRQSAAVGSPFYSVLSYPNDSPPDVQVWYRSVFSKNPVQLAKVPAGGPVWVMIQRAGNLFSAGLSSDGVNYQVIPGSTADVDLPTTALQGIAVDSGSSSNYGTASFAGLSVGGPLSTVLAPPSSAHPCPSGWSCADLGNPSPVGDAVGGTGVITVYGSGAGFGGSSDATHYVYQSVSGNESISAQVATQSGAPAKAQDGLMMRASTAPTAPMYSFFLNPGGSATVQWRFYDGIKYSQVLPVTGVTSPAYLEIVRYQDTRYGWPNTYFTALTSSDGVNWTPVLGSTVAIDMGTGSYLAGLAATAGATGVITPATFTNAAVSAVSTAPSSTCPSTFTCADIGTGVPAGNQLSQNGSWTVQASGDIWSVYDEFRLEYQSFPATTSTTGDGTVVAHVDSQSGGGPWMRSGVMIRSGTDPQAPYYGVFVTPANGVAVQWRSSQGSPTNQVVQAGITTPRWVMAARYTDTTHNVVYYSAYSSSDGVTFTYVPNSEVALDLPGPLVAGVATDANSSSNLSVATFDSVAVQSVEQPPPNICPASWRCVDVGGALPPGQDGYTNGTWSEVGGGGDIWGTADAFHLVSQSLAGDGTVTAHITSQQNTSSWAKGGPMLRATTDPGSPYYGVFVTPGNGVVVQWRATQGGSSSQLVTTGAVPTYLMVGRYTTTGTNPQTYYTAYTSPDGANWTAVPGSTVPLTMTGSLLAGFAVTSHNQGVGSAVTLDSVSVAATEYPPPGFSCPTAWSCADIGAATPLGAQLLQASTWSVTGGGSDIWGSADAFHFVWQPLAADGSITARVFSQTSSSAWAKGGLMMRASTDPGSPYYAIFATPGNGIVVQWRALQGSNTGQVATAGTAPVFLEVTRTATTFSAATSPDGTTWTPVPGSSVSLPNLSGPLLRGLAVTSHNSGKVSTVVYDSLATTP
jgi:outer membrane protein assembly factor BamB